MVAYLLDTNVVSELRKSRPNRHVLAWHGRSRRAEAYLSTLVVGEIRQGVERIRVRDRSRAELLESWLVGLITAYRDRILPVTAEVAQQWGRLSAASRPPPAVDGLMAATAMVHRLTLVTRNVSDFRDVGVRVLNPFDPIPA